MAVLHNKQRMPYSWRFDVNPPPPVGRRILISNRNGMNDERNAIYAYLLLTLQSGHVVDVHKIIQTF